MMQHIKLLNYKPLFREKSTDYGCDKRKHITLALKILQVNVYISRSNDRQLLK